MITTTLNDLIIETLGNREKGKFLITATPIQLDLIKKNLQSKWIRSGLVINSSSKPPTTNFSAISFSGSIIFFEEGEHFSIQEKDFDYDAPDGAMIYSSPSSDFSLPTS